VECPSCGVIIEFSDDCECCGDEDCKCCEDEEVKAETEAEDK
jgi:hypothetical protein